MVDIEHMHVNHRYLLALAAYRGGRILDFGCGDGEAVAAGMQLGLDIHGVENFSSGVRGDVAGLLGRRLTIVNGDKLPYPDGYFDLILSNQVFEHIEAPWRTLPELSRVLAPSGVMLHTFPTARTIREGHFGVFLSHKVVRTPVSRPYLRLAHRLGFGANRGDTTRDEWVHHVHNFLRDKCFYRPQRDWEDYFSAAGLTFERNEIDYITFRLNNRYLRTTRKLQPLVEALFHRLAFIVVVSRHARGGGVKPGIRRNVIR